MDCTFIDEPSKAPDSSSTDFTVCRDRVYTHTAHQAQLQTMLHQQWIYRSNCDFNICCRGSAVLPVHTCVLACFSPRVCRHLTALTKESADTKQLKVNFDSAVVLELMAFMYTGFLNVSEHNAKEMLQCAEWFGVSMVVGFVHEFLQALDVASSLAGQRQFEQRKIDLPPGVAQTRPDNENTSSVTTDPECPSFTGAERLSKNYQSDPSPESSAYVKLEIMETDLSHEDMTYVDETNLPICVPGAGFFLDLTGKTHTAASNSTLSEAAKHSAVTQHTWTYTSGNTTPLVKKALQTKMLGKSHSRKIRQTSTEKTHAGEIPSETEGSSLVQLDSMPQSGTADRKTLSRKKGKGSRRTAWDCRRCGLFFPSKKILHSHVSQVHSKFACEECPEVFAWKACLTRHIQKEHRAPTVWQCPYCEEMYSVMHEFQTHCLEVHQEKKAYRCDYPDCAAKFSRVQYLHDHKDNVHAGLRVVCDKCGKHLKSGGHSSHRYTCFNTGQYLCQECGMVFNLKQSLEKHVTTIHRKISKYPCPMCSRKFADRRNLHRHMLIHNNVFPYTCDFCGDKFRHSNSLKYHIDRKHLVG